MGITQPSGARDSQSGVEYTIYTFQDCAGGSEKWQRQDSVSDMKLAMEKARDFFGTGQYCRVEIKQKYTDSKTNRIVDSTLKVFQRKSGKPFWGRLTTGLCACAGVTAFAVMILVGR